MSEPQIAPTEDQLHDAFDKLLESTSTNDGELSEPEPTPEPEPAPTPEGDDKPAPVAAKGEAPKVDKRTREGKRQSIQQEIDAETARRYTAKQEADAEEARLTTLRAERTRLETQPAAPKTEAPYIAPPAQVQAEYKRLMALPDAPKIEEFTGETGYIDWQFAVSDFVAGKRYEAQQQQQQTARQQEVLTTRFEKETLADPTFQQRFNQTPVDTRMVPYLHAHPQGADIMVYLVNHPETAQRLATLKSQASQLETIGEIVGALRASAAALPSGPASKPSPMSRAKPVIKPVTSSPDVGSDDDDGDGDDDAVSIEEHIRRENRRDSARFR